MATRPNGKAKLSSNSLQIRELIPKEKPGPTRLFTDEQILAAIRKKHGLVTKIAAYLGCSPQTVYNRIRESEELREALRLEREELLDTAEEMLFDRVKQGNFEACRFVLKTLGRNRGYTERIESRVGGESEAPFRGAAALLDVQFIESLGLSLPTLREIVVAIQKKQQETLARDNGINFDPSALQTYTMRTGTSDGNLLTRNDLTVTPSCQSEDTPDERNDGKGEGRIVFEDDRSV